MLPITMTTRNHLTARVALSSDDIRSSQRLRYRVFVEKNKSINAIIDKEKSLDRDDYDSHARHIVLIDNDLLVNGSEDYVVGSSRVITGDYLDGAHYFYSSTEFIIDKLVGSRKPLMELGRACVDSEYRSGKGLYILWLAIIKYLMKSKAELIFGVASFNGGSPDKISHALSLLHYYHLSEQFSITARPQGFFKLDRMSKESMSRQKAMMELPSLLKNYLYCGARVGRGAFLDKRLNTMDIFVYLEKSQILKKYSII